MQTLLNVPTFTEYLDRNSQINLQFISGTEVELLEPKVLFGEFMLLLLGIRLYDY